MSGKDIEFLVAFILFPHDFSHIKNAIKHLLYHNPHNAYSSFICSLVIALAYFKKWIVYPCVHIGYSTFLMDYTISMCSDWLSLDWELQVIFFPLYFLYIFLMFPQRIWICITNINIEEQLYQCLGGGAFCLQLRYRKYKVVKTLFVNYNYEHASRIT